MILSILKFRLKESFPINLNNSLELYMILLSLTTVFITFSNNKKIIVLIYTLLGVIGLCALSLFVLSGSASVLGVHGTILLVTILHMLIIPRLHNGFRILKKIIRHKIRNFFSSSSSTSSSSSSSSYSSKTIKCKKVKNKIIV